jgi:hypothetical protein
MYGGSLLGQGTSLSECFGGGSIQIEVLLVARGRKEVLFEENLGVRVGIMRHVCVCVPCASERERERGRERKRERKREKEREKEKEKE